MKLIVRQFWLGADPNASELLWRQRATVCELRHHGYARPLINQAIPCTVRSNRAEAWASSDPHARPATPSKPDPNAVPHDGAVQVFALRRHYVAAEMGTARRRPSRNQRGEQ
jgi:hypothetical protein